MIRFVFVSAPVALVMNENVTTLEVLAATRSVGAKVKMRQLVNANASLLVNVCMV